MTDLWFGTTQKMVSVPAPDLPFTVDDVGFSEGFGFENGGWVEAGSQGFAKRYDFAYNIGDAAELRQIRQFRQGSFGSGLLHFADPFAYQTNLFSPAWAEPGLIEGGDWPNIYDHVPTFSAVSANSYGQPLRKATWNVTGSANTAPSKGRSQFVIPIPPSMTLHVGVSGSATGDGVVRLTGHNIAAGTSSGSNLTLLSDTSSTRLNASLAGSSYDYAVVDFRRSSSGSSTVTVTSMLAQLWPTGVTPTLTGDHVPGDGATGLRFAGGQQSSAYRLLGSDANYRSLGFTLVEVGAWL